MKHLVIIGSYPPSKQGLNEYTYEITKSVESISDTKITVLCDLKEEFSESNSQVSVRPFWSYNDPFTSIRLLREIRKLNPDVVWMNLLYSTFGDKSVPAMLGLFLPLLLKLFGIPCVSTLHHISEFIDLNDSKFKYLHPLLRAGMKIATRLILESTTTTVTLDKYKASLLRDFPGKPVQRVSHGFIGNKYNLEAPLNGLNILLFGKFGSYKKVEPAIEILDRLKEKIPNARLIIAGGDHPNYPGYIDSVQSKYKTRSDIDFLGYIPDEDLDAVFLQSDVMIQPYTSTTGISGVSHLAASYGLPIVCPDLPEFIEGAKEEDYNILVYDRRSNANAVRVLSLLFTERTIMREIGHINFIKSQNNSIEQVALKLCKIMGLHITSQEAQEVSNEFTKVA